MSNLLWKCFERNLEKIGLVVKTICINKWDLESQRVVGIEDIKDIAEKSNCQYFYTSASNGQNIEEAFNSLIEKYVSNPFYLSVRHELGSILNTEVKHKIRLN